MLEPIEEINYFAFGDRKQILSPHEALTSWMINKKPSIEKNTFRTVENVPSNFEDKDYGKKIKKKVFNFVYMIRLDL